MTAAPETEQRQQEVTADHDRVEPVSTVSPPSGIWPTVMTAAANIHLRTARDADGVRRAISHAMTA